MVTSWSTPREMVLQGKPCTLLSWRVGYCDLAVYVLKDEPRVLIGQGDFPPREADFVEVEALAERFNSDELRAAYQLMQTKAKILVAILVGEIPDSQPAEE